MQSPMVKTILPLFLFVELFFGFPASDYEHLIGYVVPGLADVQAQVKCVPAAAARRHYTMFFWVLMFHP